MAPVPYIFGFIHVEITGVIQLVSVIRNHLVNCRFLASLLDEVEEKLKRINAVSSSLSELADIAQLDSKVFSRALSNVEDIEEVLLRAKHLIVRNSVQSLFIYSSRLSIRLQDAKEKLGNIEKSFGLTIMFADMVSRKVTQKCSDLSSRLNQMTYLMNKVLAGLNKPCATFGDVLQSLGSNDTIDLTTLGLMGFHNHFLASEKSAQLYFLLGRSYYVGDHEKGINYVQAARFLHASFNEGLYSAGYYLGKLYFDGQGVQQCFKTAFNYFCVGAENEDADSMYQVAWCYDFGRGTVVDAEKAVMYYDMAAKRGSGSGMWCAGYHALHGNNCRRNWPKAVRLIQDARQAGEKRANMELAQCYEYGIHVDRDTRMTFLLLNEAHKSGDIMSIAYFARCYELGIGTEQDLEKAASLYKDIMSRNSWLSRLFQCYYGYFLVRGFGVHQNIQSGLKLLRRSLSKGHGDGWALYGDCFRFGYGVEKDSVKAISCYSKAIASPSGQRGVRNGHFALAEMYETGDGLQHNMSKAVHHYVRAANRMDSIAQWKAGSFYESGIEVDKHTHHAFYYFDLSARSGHRPAMKKAGELYMKGKGIQRDRTKAVELLEEAVKGNDPSAKRVLGKARRANLLFLSRRFTN